MKLLGVLWGSTFLVLSVVGLIGVRKDLFAAKYVVLVIIFYSLTYSLAIAVTRYRVPLEGVLAMFAGHGLKRAFQTVFGKNWRFAF